MLLQKCSYTNFLNKNDKTLLTHGKNNEKQPVYTLLNHTHRLMNKKVNEWIDKIISE